MKTNEIKVQVETKNTSPDLNGCIRNLIAGQPELRAAAASIIRNWGFQAHVGGHHVAIIENNERLALVTSTAPDFN